MMMTFHLPSGRNYTRRHTCESSFWGYQAVMSQFIMDCDPDDDEQLRRDAVDEWTKAVRAGFVCC